MFKSPQFWLGLLLVLIGLAISAASGFISFQGGHLWTAILWAGVLAAAFSPAQVIVSSAFGFARGWGEMVAMIGLLVLLAVCDGFTSYQGFDARSDAEAQATSDRNTRHSAARSALPSVAGDIADWQERLDAMETALKPDASRTEILTAQGLLSVCVPGAYTEAPDGKLGSNTRNGVSACAGEAKSELAILKPEARRLQAIVEAGAVTVETGTNMRDRVLLSVALIFFSNVFALLGGLWMARAKAEVDDAAQAAIIDQKTADLHDISDYLDNRIAELAA